MTEMPPAFMSVQKQPGEESAFLKHVLVGKHMNP